jgi:hypothetical protein
MCDITIADLENYLGLAPGTLDPVKYQLIINAVQKEIEGLLGYELCPLSDFVPTCVDWDDLRTFDCDSLDSDCKKLLTKRFEFDPNKLWVNTDPFLRLCDVNVVNCDDTILELDDPCDFLIGQNGDYNVNQNSSSEGWYNGIKLCQHFAKIPESCLCLGKNHCWQVEVVALWGLCYPIQPKTGCIPEDLKLLMLEMMKYWHDCNRDLKSESLGNYSYSKFDYQSVVDKYQHILFKYANTKASYIKRYPL